MDLAYDNYVNSIVRYSLIITLQVFNLGNDICIQTLYLFILVSP